jgi:hypothetical protein
MVFWVPAIAISGLSIYNGDAFPAWKGHAFVGAMRNNTGQHIQRVWFNPKGEPIGREIFLAEMKQRIREVKPAPDGFLQECMAGVNLPDPDEIDLYAVDRKLAWLRHLKPSVGVVWMILLVLPWFWLRAPSRPGLLPPTVAWRGADGLLLGGGVHLPWRGPSIDGEPSVNSLGKVQFQLKDGPTSLLAACSSPTKVPFKRAITKKL